mmetsp:Transcript_28871/g.52224  ORF Transcript_28871/g.52224 Transcript_28871/m.52224 type:complete len:242 (-) Transcript_28871:92-817(-)|eukprot:CAMPEP_0202504528 /NCGR_PEP_ID=MMETSP1361-20130828/44797_1 /ASSEMBLY_ACC=CAM_ASM_000849 /TAXON_ID=210615 /ORGANISM="Staurosira complex sp., Strain CCMP2646" /LENGTH=241 /DNA_ID=CAMNT_0049138053 /DNA_START=178 /DNA_END=903 /DNA_ORIENTATION=-
MKLSRIYTVLIVAYMLQLSFTDGFMVVDQMPMRSTCTHSRLSMSSYLDNLSSANPLSSSSWQEAASPATTSSTSTDFEYVPILSLSQADMIADNVIACCQRNGFNPVTVNVLDASGFPLVQKRMDGCSPVGIPDFSKAKAFSCIVNKYPSRAFRDRYTADDSSAKFCQMTTMVDISQGQMAPFPGGILVMLGDYMIGAVGVSGAAGDEDEYCAIRGVLESNLGLSTVPEKHSCSTVQDVRL